MPSHPPSHRNATPPKLRFVCDLMGMIAVKRRNELRGDGVVILTCLYAGQDIFADGPFPSTPLQTEERLGIHGCGCVAGVQEQLNAVLNL